MGDRVSVVRGDVVADVLRWWSSVATNSGLCVVKGGWGRGKSFIARSLLDADLRSEWWPGLVPGGGGGVGPLVVGSLRDRDAGRVDPGDLHGWTARLRAQLEADSVARLALDARAKRLAEESGVHLGYASDEGDSDVRPLRGTTPFNVISNVEADQVDARQEAHAQVEHLEARLETPLEQWESLLRPVLVNLGAQRGVLLVVDALDELDEDLQRFVADRLTDVSGHPGVGVLVTSRPEVPLQLDRLASRVVDLEDPARTTQSDAQLVELAAGLLGDPDSPVPPGLVGHVARQVADQAQGSWLFVKWVCLDLLGSLGDLLESLGDLSPDEVGDRLEQWSPPQDLDALLVGFTDRLEESVAASGWPGTTPGPGDWELARKALGVLAVAASEGLTAATVARALSNDGTRLKQSEVSALFGTAGHYLSVVDDDGEQRWWRVGHAFLAEWWTRPRKAGAKEQPAGRLVPAADAHWLLAQGLAAADEPWSTQCDTPSGTSPPRTPLQAATTPTSSPTRSRNYWWRRSAHGSSSRPAL